MNSQATIPVFISQQEIAARIAALGAEINRAYAGQSLTVICVLKGSVIFFADLIRQIQVPLECEFISVSSYGKATRSSGEVKLNLDITSPLAGKHLLIVEDIVDSGLTLRFLKELLAVRAPASLRVAALLDKPGARKTELALDFVGFSIPERFVVGFGLDHAERYRELPYIGVIAAADTEK